MLTKALFRSEDLLWIQARTGKNYELIRGELFEVSPASWRHGQVALRTGQLIANWNDQAQLGEVAVEGGFTLERDPDTVRGPDVSFVLKGRITREEARRGFPDLAPDLAVEVRSPNDTWAELVEKAEQLLAAGARMVVLVEPDQFLEVRRPGRAPERLGPDDTFGGEGVLPGFRCRVQDLFP